MDIIPPPTAPSPRRARILLAEKTAERCPEYNLSKVADVAVFGGQ